MVFGLNWNNLVPLAEGTKPYVLTDLGRQFVHYTMNEVVKRIAASGS